MRPGGSDDAGAEGGGIREADPCTVRGGHEGRKLSGLEAPVGGKGRAQALQIAAQVVGPCEEEPEGGVTASGRIARPLRAEQVQHERDRHLGSERRLGARARARLPDLARWLEENGRELLERT